MKGLGVKSDTHGGKLGRRLHFRRLVEDLVIAKVPILRSNDRIFMVPQV